MNYNPSPREDFIKSNQNVQEHHEIVSDGLVQRSLGVAMLEYVRRQSRMSAPDLGGCAACHLRVQGAQEFLEIFLNLCETFQAAPKMDTTNLPSNVKPLVAKKA